METRIKIKDEVASDTNNNNASKAPALDANCNNFTPRHLERCVGKLVARLYSLKARLNDLEHSLLSERSQAVDSVIIASMWLFSCVSCVESLRDKKETDSSEVHRAMDSLLEMLSAVKKVLSCLAYSRVADVMVELDGIVAFARCDVRRPALKLDARRAERATNDTPLRIADHTSKSSKKITVSASNSMNSKPIQELAKSYCPNCKKKTKVTRGATKCAKCSTKLTHHPHHQNKCDRKPSTPRNLRVYLLRKRLMDELRKRKQCPKCGKRIAVYRSLHQHWLHCDREPKLRCDHCFYRSKSEGKLASHTRRRHANWRCEIF